MGYAILLWHSLSLPYNYFKVIVKSSCHVGTKLWATHYDNDEIRQNYIFRPISSLSPSSWIDCIEVSECISVFPLFTIKPVSPLYSDIGCPFQEVVDGFCTLKIKRN